MKSIPLINEGNSKDKLFLLEQYKLIADNAERITERRQTMNNYYLGINSFLVSVSSYLTITGLFFLKLAIPILGIGLSVIWWKNINSYKQLNSAKFKIIHELETYLPANAYAKEHEYLNKGGYYGLTNIEKKVPWVFMVLYGLLLGMTIVTALWK